MPDEIPDGLDPEEILDEETTKKNAHGDVLGDGIANSPGLIDVGLNTLAVTSDIAGAGLEATGSVLGAVGDAAGGALEAVGSAGDALGAAADGCGSCSCAVVVLGLIALTAGAAMATSFTW